MAFWSWSKVIPRLSVHDTRHSWRKGDCVADFQKETLKLGLQGRQFWERPK